MSIYKLRAVGTGGTENSLASLDIQFDGDIVAVHGSLSADLDADLEEAIGEVSFMSTNSVSSNDARGSIFLMGVRTNETATGKGSGHANSGIGGLAIPVSAGERLHIHMVATAGVDSGFHVYLYVNDGQPPGIRRRR